MLKMNTPPTQTNKEIPFDLPQFRKRQEKFQRMEAFILKLITDLDAREGTVAAHAEAFKALTGKYPEKFTSVLDTTQEK